MTTTAFDDQFTSEPEPVRQTYSTADILRRNVADLEVALREQTERAEKAEAELAKAREHEREWCAQLCEWLPVRTGYEGKTFAEAIRGEGLGAKLAEGFIPSTFLKITVPVPTMAAPAVPEELLKCWLIESPASSDWPAIWLTITTDGRRWVSDGGTMYATGGDWYFTSAASEALKFAEKESADEYIRHNKIKDVVVTEHIFDNRTLLQSAEVTK